MIERDTIFALSSGRPPAAVSVIRISGSRAHRAGELIAGSLPAPRTASVRVLRNPGSGEVLDEALVLRFDSPATATGEDVVELQCHGGRAVVDAILEALGRVDGLRHAQPGEFTRRAFSNGRIDLTEAEGLADLLEAETQSQRRAALGLAEGGFRRQIEQWRHRLLDLSAAVERAIDYDEDDEEIDQSILDACAGLATELDDWLARPRVEPLKNGLRVVVAGPPNAGKSSLVNALVGEDRSIVTDVPGTTRDHIEVPITVEGFPLRLTDTAGLREADDEIEAIGVERARRLITGADMLLWLGPVVDAPTHPRGLLLQPKSDMVADDKSSSGAVKVSAVSGEGLDRVLGWLAQTARTILAAEDGLAVNRRQADFLSTAADALGRAGGQTEIPILAEELRVALSALNRIVGREGVEDVLDALFFRFCLGK